MFRAKKAFTKQENSKNNKIDLGHYSETGALATFGFTWSIRIKKIPASVFLKGTDKACIVDWIVTCDFALSDFVDGENYVVKTSDAATSQGTQSCHCTIDAEV